MFRDLAARDVETSALETRFRAWLELERDLQSALGVEPTVHG
jgi:hypothetical protein